MEWKVEGISAPTKIWYAMEYGLRPENPAIKLWVQSPHLIFQPQTIGGNT